MPRSIDLQDLLSKVQAMQEAYQGVIYQPETNQRYFGLYVNQMFGDRQRQPVQIPSPQEPQIQINKRKEEERRRERRQSEARRNRPAWRVMDQSGKLLAWEDDPCGRIVDMKA